MTCVEKTKKKTRVETGWFFVVRKSIKDIMLKKSFALSNERWEHLVDSFQIEFPSPTLSFPSHIESQGVTLDFQENTIDRVMARPEILYKSRPYLKYIVPDIIRCLTREDNANKSIDLGCILVKHELSKHDPAQLDFILGCVTDVLDAMKDIHASLHPRMKTPFPMVQLKNNASSNDPSILSKLDMVVGMVKDFANTEAISTYLREYPNLVGHNLQKYQETCFKLCVQVLEDRSSWMSNLQHLKDRIEKALHVSYGLIAEMSKVHGYLQQMQTLTDPASKRHLPPLLQSMTRRAVHNFTKDCRKILEAVCPDGVSVIFGDTIRTRFDTFQADQLCRFEGVIFDTWANRADMHDASKSLIMLCDVFRNFAKRSPLDVFDTHTELSSILQNVDESFPSRFYIQSITTVEILEKATKVAGISGVSPNSISSVYRHLVKKRAREAVNAGRFHVQTELRFFQIFYKQVLPTMYSSGILAMRTYQVYRDLCSIMGLPFEPYAEKVFFEHTCETLILDPFDWVPPPVLSRPAAALMSACRDLVLSVEEIAVLSPSWIQRLSCLEKKKDIQAEYEHIRNELQPSQ